MEQTKNTTATERRIRRRSELADQLRRFCETLGPKGYETKWLFDIAIELHIANTESVLAQQWASDPKPGPRLRDGDPLQAIHDEMLETMRRDPIETGRTTVTVGAVNIPGRREPGIALQHGADGRLGPTPAVTEAMVDRALDDWDQYAGGFMGKVDYYVHRRAAMRHVLERALGVRL